ncbi:MAG: hypothetical protein IK066_11720 [Kiritimatiellae bacterium]|nr:hypothetical protein [Kiritimatiellia bacterium]
MGRSNVVRGEVRRASRMVRGGPGWLAWRRGWAWRVVDLERVVADGFAEGRSRESREAARRAARAAKRAWLATGNAGEARRAGERAAEEEGETRRTGPARQNGKEA